MCIDHIQAQQDEGYSEDTQSTAEYVDAMDKIRPLSDTAQMLLRSLESLSLEDRVGILRCATSGLSTTQQQAFIKDILAPLPTWAKQDISSHLDTLIYFDPIRYFPYEIVQDIFSHLNPQELCAASAVSREWRFHTQEEELWRACFRREGWQVDQSKIRAAEQAARERAAKYGFRRRDSKKRRLDEALDELEASCKKTFRNNDDRMEGVELNESAQGHRQGRRPSLESSNSVESAGASLLEDQVRIKPPIMHTRLGIDGLRVSWAWLYKQRRLLEKNWDKGNCQIFRLPHPKYESEGHSECVYTIQHVGNLLVSGSRDRTIRRWDLDTYRLKGAPLQGHDASVLCLQFDPTPGNDIIVSGGSDSWVIIWKFSTGEIIKKMTTAHSDSVLNLRFDDRYIVTCSKDKTIKIWNRREITSSDPIIPRHTLSQYPEPNTLIPEFSLLARFNGHGAAVNAVMIHEDRIVSASGDRAIKAWSITLGKCVKTYTGHGKGIACVQYDGRRIISGSSDNTVRIFDAEQQAEVACLHGHSKLVRTVQARFGDLEVTSDQELHEEARQADLKWSQAMARGAQPASGSRRSLRNPGSSRPEDMLSIGAKVPPGGGGTRWAKIVSGGYDETILIWRKDHDGKWTVRHKLELEMLYHQQRVRVQRPRHPPGQPMPGAFPPQNILDAPAAGPSTAPSNEAQAPSISTQQTTTTTTTRPTVGASAGSQPGRDPPTTNAILHTRQPLHGAIDDRVFKLQFDTRRIISCTSQRTIVGWDFSNGNDDLAKVGNWCTETF